MKKSFDGKFALAAIAALLGSSVAAAGPMPLPGQVVAGQVLQVYDGDGLWFDDGDGNPKTLLQVRLFGINAQEYNSPKGVEAKQFLRARMLGQNARCNIVAIDKAHKRPVGICFNAAGGDVSCMLVWYGHAVATDQKYYPCDRSRLPPPGPPPF
ncbi:MAG: hypothetical protein SGJ03_16985 [Alphaproteobacteria bacterium]|nr:hypothetical protein [Alphaproteobacteria bacterium]